MIFVKILRRVSLRFWDAPPVKLGRLNFEILDVWPKHIESSTKARQIQKCSEARVVARKVSKKT